MKPGDLVRLNEEHVGDRCSLTQRPGFPSSDNGYVGTLDPSSVALVLAIVTVSRVTEACLLHDGRIGWNFVNMFRAA